MSNRRHFLTSTLYASAATVAGCSMPVAKKSAIPSGQTFVLAHGSWHGGWCWGRVAQRLRDDGHLVVAPSFSGMGDRAHLLSPSITIQTFVQDLVQVIEVNDYNDVILVGHSFAGVPISGVADLIPSRLKHLVFLDALILESGKSSFSMYPPEEAAQRIAAAEKSGGGLAVPPPAKLPPVWGLVEGSKDYEWVAKHLTPQPLKSYTTALTLRNPIGNGVPKTYVECTQPQHPVLSASRALVASQQGWTRVELAAPHDAMITHPDQVAGLLRTI